MWVLACFVVCLVVVISILVVYGGAGFGVLARYTFVFWIGGFCGFVGVGALGGLWVCGRVF